MIEPITNESVEATVRKRAWEKRTYPFRIIGYTCLYWYYELRSLLAKSSKQQVIYKLEVYKYFCLLPTKWRRRIRNGRE